MQRRQAEKLIGTTVHYRTWELCGEGILRSVRIEPGHREAIASVELTKCRSEKDGTLRAPGALVDFQVGQVDIGPFSLWDEHHYDQLARIAGDLLEDPPRQGKTYRACFELPKDAEGWLEERIAWEKRTFKGRNWPEHAWLDVTVMKIISAAAETWPGDPDKPKPEGTTELN